MKSPLQRIRRGAVTLAIISLVAVIGYRIAGYDWIESLWILTVTISTVGYAEKSSGGPAFQLFSVLVIVFGMTAAAYTFGGFVQMVLEGEIAKTLGLRRMTRDIERLNKHVIICGYGRTGQFLAQVLQNHQRPFVIVDEDTNQVTEATENGFLCLHGDATDENVLRDAGIERAEYLVSGLPNDAANVFITLTARNMNSEIQIIARAELQSTERKLRQAGANRIVMPTIIGAMQMERLITRPTTADLMQLVSESTYLDVELDEITITEDSALAGVAVRQTGAYRDHRLLVVAAKTSDGRMLFNPDTAQQFDPGDVVIVMGRVEDIQAMRKEYGV